MCRARKQFPHTHAPSRSVLDANGLMASGFADTLARGAVPKEGDLQPMSGGWRWIRLPHPRVPRGLRATLRVPPPAGT